MKHMLLYVTLILGIIQSHNLFSREVILLPQSLKAFEEDPISYFSSLETGVSKTFTGNVTMALSYHSLKKDQLYSGTSRFSPQGGIN
ncbi:MAG: hypothetical protein OEZ36_05330, partial [Spirochaetota bacterium]|nr:hypothetical protein [Spirochaetota bacterium]